MASWGNKDDCTANSTEMPRASQQQIYILFAPNTQAHSKLYYVYARHARSPFLPQPEKFTRLYGIAVYRFARDRVVMRCAHPRRLLLSPAEADNASQFCKCWCIQSNVPFCLACNACVMLGVKLLRGVSLFLLMILNFAQTNIVFKFIEFVFILLLHFLLLACVF